MNSRQVIAGLIIVLLIASLVYVMFLIIQEPNDNPLDTTPPVVTILSPDDGAQLSGLATIEFNATDLNPIVEHEIRIDSVVRDSFTSFEWNTTVESDGVHTITWDGTDDKNKRVAPGVYFCVLNTNGHSIRKKIVSIE